MAIVAIVNQKGGVGKTTLSLNLAHGLAREGKKVLAVDNDAQANLTRSFLAEVPEGRSSSLFRGRLDNPQTIAPGLFLLGADDSLEDASVEASGPDNFCKVLKALDVKGVFDFVLIDCHPGLSNLTLAAMMAASHILIPLTPSEYAFQGLNKLFREIKRLRSEGYSNAEPLGFVVNLMSPTTYNRHNLTELRRNFPDLQFESVLRRRTAFEESPALRKSVFDHEPNGAAALEMGSLVREFIKRMERVKA